MSSREMDMLTKLLGFESLMEGLEPRVYQGIDEIARRLYKDNSLLYVIKTQDLFELLQYPYFNQMESCLFTIACYLAECQKTTNGGNPPPLPSKEFKELEKYLKILCQMEQAKRRDIAAVDAISPPFSDAEEYLDDDEYKPFLNSVSHAIDAYLDQTEMENLYCPELWLEYSPEYTRWLSIIHSRKEKAANSKNAQMEYEQYKIHVEHLIAEVKSRLTTEKPKRFTYPKHIEPYMPDQWCELELPTKQEVVDWAKTRIKEIMPVEVLDYIKWKCSHKILTIPAANYQMLGIPCLTWTFTLWVFVTLNLYPTKEIIHKHFRGISYPLKLPNEELGYHDLGPVECDTLEGFTTPLTLLVMLSEGKIEQDGIEIISHEDQVTTYEVKGYDGEPIEIHDLFRQFLEDVCKDKPLSHGLLSAGIVDKTTASLIENKGMIHPTKQQNIQAEHGGKTDNNADVTRALEVLGYKKSEGLQMVEKAQFHENMSLEDKVQAALKTLGD